MSELKTLWKNLGIRQSVIDQCRMPLCTEPDEVTPIGEDVFGRPQFATSLTSVRWQLMRTAAETAGINLQVVSAYRTIEYQCTLWQAKLDRGDSIEEILKVNAVPGFSEHHTGRALDLTTPEFEPLSEHFEESAAFAWLSQHAREYDFVMSYSRDNPYGLIYEPWHWCCQSG